jgi:hypothetical protein
LQLLGHGGFHSSLFLLDLATLLFELEADGGELGGVDRWLDVFWNEER